MGICARKRQRRNPTMKIQHGVFKKDTNNFYPWIACCWCRVTSCRLAWNKRWFRVGRGKEGTLQLLWLLPPVSSVNFFHPTGTTLLPLSITIVELSSPSSVLLPITFFKSNRSWSTELSIETRAQRYSVESATSRIKLLMADASYNQKKRRKRKYHEHKKGKDSANH